MDLLQVIQQLGLPGLLFLACYLVAHVAIIEFVKVLGAALKRKAKRAEGENVQPGESVPFLQGLAAIVFSLVLGLGLGGLMLNGVAALAGIDLPRPLSGSLLGLVLAVIVSGWYARQQKLARAKGVDIDALTEALSRLQPTVVTPAAFPVPTPLPNPQPELVTAPPLRPATARDAQVSQTTGDWNQP